jgi:hypothetical protein
MTHARQLIVRLERGIRPTHCSCAFAKASLRSRRHPQDNPHPASASLSFATALSHGTRQLPRAQKPSGCVMGVVLSRWFHPQHAPITHSARAKTGRQRATRLCPAAARPQAVDYCRVLRSLKLPGFDLARRGDPLRIRPGGCRMHLPNDGLRTETLWRHLTI